MIKNFDLFEKYEFVAIATETIIASKNSRMSLLK
jgi:hypothetical protein